MGGGQRYPYPAKVWSPLGGWWLEEYPKGWQRSVFRVGVVSVFFIGGITYLSLRLAHRARNENLHHRYWRPSISQAISPHIREDIPNYDQLMKEYKERPRASFWSRFLPGGDGH